MFHPIKCVIKKNFQEELNKNNITILFPYEKETAKNVIYVDYKQKNNYSGKNVKFCLLPINLFTFIKTISEFEDNHDR